LALSGHANRRVLMSGFRGKSRHGPRDGVMSAYDPQGTSKAFMCRQRNSNDAFRLEVPEAGTAVPKMPTLLDEAECAGKTNISKYETRSSESAGLGLTNYDVTDTIPWGHYE
jgi:hypothetical protein